MDSHPPRPVATTLHLLLPLLAVLATAVFVLAALAGAGVWLLRSDEGTRWLFAHLPGIQVDEPRGALLGEDFAARRIHVEWGGGQHALTLTDLRAEGLHWSWRPQPGAWIGLTARRLAAHEVIYANQGPPGPAPELPASIGAPVRLSVAELRVDRLSIAGLPPFLGVSGAVEVGDAGRYRLDRLALDWEKLHVQGRATLGAERPFALDAALQVQPANGEFQATVGAGGTLGQMALQARLAGPARAGHAAPTAEVHAEIRPFAAWPLAALDASTSALDLASISAAAPETRLGGRVRIDTRGRDAPIGASVVLDNALPGRWDQHRLPLRRIALELQGSAATPGRIEIHAADLLLAAGRWQGHGSWRGHTLDLDGRLTDVQPQQLDRRAAAMTLSGPLAFTLHGLPSPDPAASAAPPPFSINLHTTLDGRLAARPLPVQLALVASADAGRIEIAELRARSGSASARLQASARHIGSGPWQIASTGSLNDFDPLPWWPGDAASPWRGGGHKISADWKLDLQLPQAALKLAPLALAQRVAGTGKIHVHDSLLAGVPVALDLDLAQTPAAHPGRPSRLHGELTLGGNHAVLDAQGDPAGAGGSDSLNLKVDAPALAALAPLLRLEPGLAAWAPSAGSASLGLEAEGRWPRLRSHGQIQLAQLASSELALDSARATWQVDLDDSGSAPLDLDAEADNLRLGHQSVRLLRARMQGTLRQHRISLSAALPLVPPPWAGQLLGVNALSGTRVRVEGDGAWQPAPGGGGVWSGHLSRLAVGAWDGASLAAQKAQSEAGWISASDLRADLRFDADGNLAQVHAQPGHMSLAGAAALDWDAIQLDLGGAAPNIDLRARIQAFSVAPLLARAQPAMGWGGDLRLSASVEVHAAERFDADIVFERVGGDLSVRDEAGTQTLGLSDLRLGLAAHDGTWVFTQALAGKSLGEAAGAARVHTTPQARWPGADAPLDGVLTAHVANLGIWGAWVPAGWRLSGEMRTGFTLGGRFGAPEYTGELSGSDLGVRNIIQGVNVSRGQVAIKLEGARAQISRFRFESGDGRLDLSGGAEFGSAPKARLHLEAEHFRVLGRIDRQLIASGSADLDLQRDGVRLDGKFRVDEGLFDTSRGDAPTLDSDVTVHRPGEPELNAEAAAGARGHRNVAVAVDVDLGQNLRVRGHGLDTELRGLLHITTPAGKLAVHGSVHTEGGTYAAYGQKLAIERGIITFTGAPDNPRLDILAVRPDIDTKVGVSVTGTLQTVRARLYSEPDMPDTDKLSWLLLGRAPDGLGRSDTAMLQSAAVALLEGENGAPTDSLMRRLGLDELTVRQSDTDVQQTVISVGKQLTRRWYVGYERGVNATAGTFQLIYRIAQRFTLRAQGGAENSLDLIWSWKFGKPANPAPAASTPN
ncbi:MAG: translocation/assembly module TamB domain-containing protein [Burkholderiales bacterium]|nr:translocation/assembly module TamB domain-containing protein [Burkholderiales bacterium]